MSKGVCEQCKHPLTELREGCPWCSMDRKNGIIDRLEAENATLREQVSDVAEKLLDPLVDWNSHLRRGATSIPQRMTNQIDAASQALKRYARGVK